MNSPRSRLLAVMAGESVERPPFLIWDNKLPDPATTQALLELGATIIVKSAAYTSHLTGVTCRRHNGGDGCWETTYETSAGRLFTRERAAPGTVWKEKHLFTGPEDYPALSALIQSRVYTPAYAPFHNADQRYGASALARLATLHSPLQEIMYDLMGLETFSVEWAERRDEIDVLCALLAADQRRQWAVLADAPAAFVIVEANVVPEVWGTDRIREYSLPHIAAACDFFHRHGKLVGAHFDGDTRALAPLLAATHLDFIESFTPEPDGDLTLTAARAAWPGKGLLVNFPSSVHVSGVAAVEALADQLRAEARGGAVAIGVIENIPETTNTLLPLARHILDNSHATLH